MNALNQTRDSFSFARFWAFTMRYLDEHKKTLGLGAGVIAGIVFFFAIWIGTSEFFKQAEVGGSIDRQMFVVVIEMMILYGIFGLYSTIMGSLTFSSMKSKKLRISAMMVPAAKSEKYWTYILIYDILATLFYMAIVILADYTRSVISGDYSVWEAISFYNQQTVLNTPLISTWQIIAAMILVALFSQAMYVFGSSLWPRNSFIITFCVIFVLQMVFVFLFDARSVIEYIDSPSYAAYMIGTSAAIIALYALAWWRFNKTQLVQRFMMN